MTIRIPVKLLLFVLYTVAILGGAFGISYAVFEWREDDGGSASGPTLESLDGRIDSLSNRVNSLAASGGSGDSSQCHTALIELTGKTVEGANTGLTPSLEQAIREIWDRLELYC